MINDIRLKLLNLEEYVLLAFVATIALPLKYNAVFLGLLIFTNLFFNRFPTSIKTIKASKVFLPLLIYYGTLFFSLFISTDVRQGFKSLETKLALLAIPILLSGLPWSVALRNKVLRVFIISIVATSIYSIISTIIIYKIDFSDWSYFSWALTITVDLSANHYSIYVSFALLFLLIGYREFKLFNQGITLAAGLYLLAFLMLLSSRMSIALFVFIYLIYLIKILYQAKSKKEKVITLATLSLFLLFITISVFTVPYLKDRIRQVTNGLSNDPRYKISQVSFTIIKKHPIIGVGLGDLQHELNYEYSKIDFEEALKNEYGAHNDWIGSYISAGILGFAALLYFFLSLIRSTLHKNHFTKIAFIVFFLLASQTESIFDRHKGVMIFSFLFTLIFIVDIFIFQKGEIHSD